MPPELAGETCRWLVRRLNTERQAILLAVDRNGALHINPGGSFALEQADALFVVARSRPGQLEELAD